MTSTMRSIGIMTVALATLAAATVACGSKKSGGGTPAGLSPIIKGNGSPANLACNHTFADPATTNTTVGFRLETGAQQLSGSTTDVPGIAMVVYDVASGTTTGAAVLSSGNAIATMPVKDSTRYAFKGTYDATIVPTYGFNFLSPVVGTTSGTIVFRVIPTTIYNAFIGLLGVSPTAIAGTVQFAGAVGDCTDQGAQLQFVRASIPGGHNCGDDLTPPCIAYIKNGTPNVGATETDSDGAFIVAGLPANQSVTVTVSGVIAAGGAIEPIGSIVVKGNPDTIALGATNPLSN
jgi:hypothetical protein